LRINGFSLGRFLVSGEGSTNRLEDQIMIAYEFYWLDSKGGCEIIGVLPERRKQTERLTKESITHWGEKLFSKDLNTKDIFFIQVMIDDATGRVFRPTPFSIPRKEISE
jgi:hypothetical protein